MERLMPKLRVLTFVVERSAWLFALLLISVAILSYTKLASAQ